MLEELKLRADEPDALLEKEGKLETTLLSLLCTEVGVTAPSGMLG